MGRKNTNRRSFFEWAMPDHVMDVSKLLQLGILALLLALVLAYCGAQFTRHLSVDGGRDEIAAGDPFFDGGIPQDQIAAGYPRDDDPQRLSVANDPVVGNEPPVFETPAVDEAPPVDDSEELEDGTEEESDGDPSEDISDESTERVDVSRFGIGSWDITIRESGEAACGYPEGSYEYPATVTIGVAPADGFEPSENLRDWSDTMTLLRFTFQLNSGPSSAVPLGLSGGDDTHSSHITVTELDLDNGTLEATEVYRSGDCTTRRMLVGVGF